MGSYAPHQLNLNRAQRRRLAAAAPAVDRITAADAAFFRRFPHRRHRLRRMGANEREQMLAAGGQDSAKPDEAWAVAVREVVPGARMRRFFTCRADTDLDQPESIAAGIFQQLAENDPRTAAMEAQIRAVMGQKANER